MRVDFASLAGLVYSPRSQKHPLFQAICDNNVNSIKSWIGDHPGFLSSGASTAPDDTARDETDESVRTSVAQIGDRLSAVIVRRARSLHHHCGTVQQLRAACALWDAGCDLSTDRVMDGLVVSLNGNFSLLKL